MKTHTRFFARRLLSVCASGTLAALFVVAGAVQAADGGTVQFDGAARDPRYAFKVPLTPAEKSAIFRDNAVNLFGLK